MNNSELSDQFVREGVVYLNNKDFTTARQKFKDAASAHPGNVDAFYNLGAAELYLGNTLAAIKAYQDALKIAPTDYEVLYNLGTVYLGTGELENAITYFKKSVEINPYYVNALNNLGVAYQYLNDFESSTKTYEEVIRIKDDDFIAYNNLGVSISKQGLPARSVLYFQKAIDINSNYEDAYNNLGNALQQLGSYKEALEFYKRALEIKPDYLEALINIASDYQELGDLGNSVTNYEKALEIDPNNPQTLSHLLHIYQQICDFSKVNEYKTRLKTKNLDPLINIMYSDNLEDNLEVAKAWSADVVAKTRALEKFKYNWKNKKIKIGYLNNFQDKPVGYLIKDLFKNHNRKKFEIYAFSYGSAAGGDLREQVAKDVDHFIDIANLNNQETARLINDKQIDILIDLKGYTKGQRMEVMARRPARVQVTYLGFPGTTGAGFFDYIITDKILTPPVMAKFFSEKFLYMPGCYQIYSAPHYQKLKVSRADYNLPRKGVIFSSLNQTVKIDEELFKSFMRIIKAVPGSVLWLHGSNALAIQNLRASAVTENIDPDRLIFADSVGFDEHLSRIPLADIALDPYAYSGGATTAHTLWCGVPVLTKTGKHYLSRMSTSLVTNAGLKECICKTKKEYEEIAIELAINPVKLKRLKSKLINNRYKPMFNPGKFVKDLEKHLETIHELAPRHA